MSNKYRACVFLRHTLCQLSGKLGENKSDDARHCILAWLQRAISAFAERINRHLEKQSLRYRSRLRRVIALGSTRNS